MIRIVKKYSVMTVIAIIVLYLMFVATNMSWALDAGFTINQIKYANMVRDGADVIVPTLVQGTKNGVAVAEWGAARITPAIGSKIIGKFISGAGLLGVAYYGSELVSYLYDKGYSYIQGELNKQVAGPGLYTYPWLASDYLSTNYPNCTVMGSDAAGNAWFAARSGNPHYYNNIGSAHIYVSYDGSDCIVQPYPDYESQVNQGQGVVTNSPATPQQITELETSIQSDLTAQTAPSLAVMDKIINKVEDAIGSKTDQLTTAQPATVEQIKNELKQAISQTQKDSMDDKAAQTDAEKQYGDQAAKLTKGDLQDVINKAISDGGAVTGPTLAAEIIPTLPEKITITSVLNTWWSGFQSLPIVSMFTGLTVTASGSAVISLPIPAFLGGSSTNFTYDFSQHSAVWDFMGNILLMLTGITWTMYLFEG